MTTLTLGIRPGGPLSWCPEPPAVSRSTRRRFTARLGNGPHPARVTASLGLPWSAPLLRDAAGPGEGEHQDGAARPRALDADDHAQRVRVWVAGRARQDPLAPGRSARHARSSGQVGWEPSVTAARYVVPNLCPRSGREVFLLIKGSERA